MILGRISFNEKAWGKMSYANFKKNYKPWEDKTGIETDKAAKMLGVEVPKSKKKTEKQGA